MSRIAQYDIITAGDSKSLADKVNEKIADGWKPFGNPFPHAGHLLQALVLTTKAEKRIRKTSED